MEHIKEIREQMKKLGIDYYIAYNTDPHGSEYICNHYKEIEYISGFSGDNATLLVTAAESFLWTDGRYFIQAEQELDNAKTKLMKMGDRFVPGVLEVLLGLVNKGETLGVNGLCSPYKAVNEIEKLCELKGAKLKYGINICDGIWNDREKISCNMVRILDSELYLRSASKKIKKLRKHIEDKADAVFISSLDDIMWLFNIRGTDILYNPVAFSYAYISDKKAVLFLQKQVISDELLKYAAENGFVIKEYEKVVSFLEKNISGCSTVMLCKSSLNYSLCRIIIDRAAEVCDSILPTKLMKAKKSRTEVKWIRDKFLQDSVAMIKFLYWFDTTKEVRSEMTCVRKIEELRGEIPTYAGPSFTTISAYGANAAMPHYEPDAEADIRIENKSFYLVDAGGQYDGATTDMTRTVSCGELSYEEREGYTLVAAGWVSLMNAVWKKGCNGRSLDILARQKLWKRGLDFNHGTGHGVGYMLGVHEGPQAIRTAILQNEVSGVLKKGMLVTDEPGLYVQDKFGIRTENTLLVVKDQESEYGTFLKFEPLTLIPIDKKPLIAELLSNEEIEQINAYHALVYDKTAAFLEDKIAKWLKEATAPLALNANNYA